jgi:hypothetical protein
VYRRRLRFHRLQYQRQFTARQTSDGLVVQQARYAGPQSRGIGGAFRVVTQSTG